MFDTHTHTKFSHDSKENPTKLLQRAKELNLSYLAVTEHLDLAEGIDLDIDAYTKTYSALKEDYPFLSIGIECGYADLPEIGARLRKYPFEYIINSVHSVDGRDCYFPSYFDGKTKIAAYQDYYNTILESLDAPYFYHTIGHIGYIVRNAPYQDRNVDYNLLKEVVDAILDGIISRQKIVEVNANIAVESPHTPDIHLLKRYYEKGGRLITYASDAHHAGKLCQNFSTVTESLNQIGFKKLYYIRKGEYMEYKI